MSGQSLGIHALDRRQMEEERLARLAKKRPAEESEDEPNKAVKLDTNKVEQHNLAVPQPVTVSNTVPKLSSISSAAPMNPANTQIEFPHGTIRKTWAFGHGRQNDIKIEEVLRKKDLNIGVLSSFNWDFDWLVSKFDAKTKFIFVMQARNESERRHYQNEFDGISKIRLCFPPMSGNPYSCMHSKLMLLFYPHHLRVVVPSANFVPYDWGETGIMENSVFLIDLPRLPEEKQGHSNDTLNVFSKELLRFADAMKLEEDVKLGLLNFDFGNAKDIRFVHTIGGTHLGKAAEHTGLPGLGRAIRSLELQTPTKTPLEVEMAASSVGSIDHDAINMLYDTLHGNEPKHTTSTKRKTEDYLPLETVKHPESFHLIFPTRETVAQSTGGPDNGGTIFLKPDYFTRPSFPSEIIRDYKSRRTGLLSHNKLIFARSPTTAFLYMGSANLSQAAWGRPVYDKGSKGPKLTANNWECGVLVPVVRNGVRVSHVGETQDNHHKDSTQSSINAVKAEEESQNSGVLPIEVFDRVLAVPWEFPARRYEQGQKPWSAGT